MKKSKKWLKKARAFTLVEVMVVLLIIGVLVIILVPNVGTAKDTADKRSGKAVVQLVNNQKMLYEVETGNSVVDLDELVDGKYITTEQLKAYNNYLAKYPNP